MEQREETAEEQLGQEDDSIKLEEAGIILDVEESKSKVYAAELPIKVSTYAILHFVFQAFRDHGTTYYAEVCF